MRQAMLTMRHSLTGVFERVTLDDLMAQAEAIGKVELVHISFGELRRRAVIEMGEWGKIHVRIFGHGHTWEQALTDALHKIQPFLNLVPHKN